MTMTLTGWHFDDDGSPRNGKSVFYRAASTAEPNPNPILTPTTTTDVSGRWSLTVPDGTWDVYLLDGPTVRIWKAGTRLPLSFDAAAIAPGADIELTKLNQGTLDDDVNPATVTPANLQERLSQIVSQIKDMNATIIVPGDWNSPPQTNLQLAGQHISGTGGLHGLPGGVGGAWVLGESSGGGGYHAKWGVATVGAETITPTTPSYYIASVAVAFPTGYPTACVGVWTNSQWWAMAASAQGVSTGGFTLYLATQIAQGRPPANPSSGSPWGTSMDDACFTAGEVALIAGLLAALTTTITILFNLLLQARDRELATTVDQRDQYRSVARKALLSLERAWRAQRTEAGLPPVPLPVPDPNLAPEDLQARLDAVAAALAHGGPDA